MMGVTLLATDGTILWMSATPGPAIEDVVGTKLWKWATPTEAERWRSFIATALLDGRSGPYLTTYDGNKYEVTFARISEKIVVNTWRLHLPSPLTEQERKVLKFICDDVKPSAIARQLKLSVNTIETYRSRLRQKLRVDGTAGMTKWAIRVGLISA